MQKDGDLMSNKTKLKLIEGWGLFAVCCFGLLGVTCLLIVGTDHPTIIIRGAIFLPIGFLFAARLIKLANNDKEEEK